MKIGRNDSCSCGSGRKYKNCCEKKGTPTQRRWTWIGIALVGGIGVMAVAALHEDSKRERTPALERVWSEEHQHWHNVNANQPAPQPDGLVPPGKVWSQQHGHWHDVSTTQPALQPAGPVPDGKVWSQEHGHWHDVNTNPAAVGEPVSTEPSVTFEVGETGADSAAATDATGEAGESADPE